VALNDLDLDFGPDPGPGSGPVPGPDPGPGSGPDTGPDSGSGRDTGPGPGPDPGSGHRPDPAPGPGSARDTGPGRDTADETLRCGASLAALWEDGPAPGHAGCPHCADALADLAALDRTVRAAVTARGHEPDLAARVMDLVRTELRPGPLVPLEEPDGWITEAAGARLLRRAAEAVPGVAAGSCRFTALSGHRPAPPGRLPREPLRVRLEIAVDLSRPVPETATAVRHRVLAAAAEHLGLDLAQVDVTVIDLLAHPDAPTGPGSAGAGEPGQGEAGGPGWSGAGGASGVPPRGAAPGRPGLPGSSASNSGAAGGPGETRKSPAPGQPGVPRSGAPGSGSGPDGSGGAGSGGAAS
jgi:hypothetical protein